MINALFAAAVLAILAFAGGLYVGLSKVPDKVRDYSVEEDQADEIYAERARSAEAERRMKAMTLARDPAHMDDLALKLATDVEDYFARSYEGGVTQRRAVIQVAARALIEQALAGGKPDFN